MRTKKPAWAIIRVPNTASIDLAEIAIKAVYDSEEMAKSALSKLTLSKVSDCVYTITQTRRYEELEIEPEKVKTENAPEPNFLRKIDRPDGGATYREQLELIRDLAGQINGVEMRELIPLVGRISENLVANFVKGSLVDSGSSPFDVVTPKGESIDVKTVLLKTDIKHSPVLTVRVDSQVDWLAVVVFNPSLYLRGVWLVPRAVYLLHVRPNSHQPRSANIRLTESLITAPSCIQLYPSQGSKE